MNIRHGNWNQVECRRVRFNQRRLSSQTDCIGVPIGKQLKQQRETSITWEYRRLEPCERPRNLTSPTGPFSTEMTYDWTIVNTIRTLLSLLRKWSKYKIMEWCRDEHTVGWRPCGQGRSSSISFEVVHITRSAIATYKCETLHLRKEGDMQIKPLRREQMFKRIVALLGTHITTKEHDSAMPVIRENRVV